MAKSRKKPRLYVHEPEQRTFVATTSTATRLRHSYVDAPLLSAAITEDRPSQPSTSLEFGVGNPDEAFTDHDPQPVDIINVMPTDGSGLVVKTKAKRYVNSMAFANTTRQNYWNGKAKFELGNQINLNRVHLRMADVKKAMAEEEHLREERGEGTFSEMSPSAFLISGMDIEETQQELRIAASKHDLTTVEATQLQTSRTNLLKRIKKFRATQHTYMAGLSDYLKQSPSEETTSTPELMPLYLPSAFPAAQRHLICQPNLDELEDRLRFAQTTEALCNLRRQLRTRSFANSYKTRNAHSQGAYTRSRLLQNQIEVRIRAIRGQYDIARAALLSLRGPGDWETSLRPLHAEDIRGINERALTAEEQEEYRHARLLAGISPESVQGELDGHGVTSGQENAPTVAFNRSLALGEGRRTLSWIWYTVSDEEILGAGEVQASNERRRALQWEDKWRAIREHAALVMHRDDGPAVVPALIVELDLEDDNETDVEDEM
ncbi:hypothetical protein EYR36_005527 [Pleurotus pulmonarius]|nr:hypothetical protein EYR36_005527 [Pleurotus pulmonarius]